MSFTIRSETPREEQLHDLTWQGRAVTVSEPVVWYKDFRVHSAIVLGLTAVVIVVFW